MAPPPTIRILLVEDDLEDARLMKELLAEARRANFIVDSAENAEETLVKVRKIRYDIILLDYRLPDRTGLDVLSDLKKMHFRIPIILVTSHGDRLLQEEALEAGVADFLEKGALTSDLMERTCLYAIGLHEKSIRSGITHETPGVGLLVQELVGLTREGVAAQTQTALQMAEMRHDLKSEVSELKAEFKEDFQGLRTQLTQQKEDLSKKLSKPWERLGELANWISVHPIATIGIFFGLILIVALLVLLLHIVDPKNIKTLKDAMGSLEVIP